MIILSKVKESNLEELRQIKVRAFIEEFKRYGFTPEEMISLQWHTKMMKTSLYYTVMYEGFLVGGINVFKNDHGEGYLCSLFIDRKWQSKGLGSKVIKAIEELHCDVVTWNLETPSMSLQNQHFYEKCGYRFVKVIVPQGAPEGFSLRAYEKKIKENDPMKRCQSCGMPLESKEFYGTNKDGSLNEEYCKYCYGEGAFYKPDETMESMLETCVPFVMKEGFTEEQAREHLQDTLVTLKRWA